jgi:phenylalanyl-tRNA synthetase beta chain
MRLLLSWVRDFVDVKAPLDDVADRIGLRGFEVASVEPDGANDGVIDFEVTANRPDCLSVLGFAREIATAFELPIRLPSAEPGVRVPLAPVPVGETDRIAVTIEDDLLCPRYASAVADITSTATPAWMTRRLEAAGVRPISVIVDITNYVMMELGHPMHAFDLATLEGAELRIRRARAGETLRTLDSVERRLDPDMLVIADQRHPQAVAGVMGGAGSEVSASTQTVAFESAYFQPASVRRTSKRLGLKTEASSRFERGADIKAPVVALRRALALMTELRAGQLVSPIVDRYPAPREAGAVALRRARLARVLGLSVPDSDVERILRALGLSVTRTGDGWSVLVPTFRVDIAREVDLIEEVGRHYGFDRLAATFPPLTHPAPAPDPRLAHDRVTRRVLTAAGLSEAITFGFIEERAARAFADEGSLVSVANPLSALFDTLRPSLIPGLVDSVARNRRHGRRDAALFELGARFTTTRGEHRAVGIAWTGTAQPDHWSAPPREVDFFDVKGVVEQLGRAWNTALRFEPQTVGFLVPGQSAAIVHGDRRIGVAGLLAPVMAEERGAPRHDRIFVAELDLDVTDEHAPAEEPVRPLPRFPAVVRDISIVVADTLPAEIIRGTIQAAARQGAAPLATLAFFDRFTGAGIRDGAVSLSIRLTFQAPDRTLTDAEVQQTGDAILKALADAHGAVQR